MLFYLMHKDIKVMLMDVDNDGNISKLKRLDLEHCPVGGQMNDMKFYDWWKDRSIPRTRKGVNHALKELGFSSTNSFLVNGLALNLTDCYWIKPVHSDIKWADVSLFRNNFEDVFGTLTFDITKSFDMSNKTLFKCASSQGELQKKWCIAEDGRQFLVKGNWGSSYQQSLNEILASEIHEKQGVKCYTPYYLTSVDVDGGLSGLGCYSYNFCNELVESVPVWELLQTIKLKGSVSYYNALRCVCVDRLGFKEEYFDDFIGYEILTDFILSNTDRHMNNIQVLRNPDTLQYYGFAPIFDTGNSMFFRENSVPSGNLLKRVETCSFLKHEADMLKYVRNRNLVDISRLPTDDYLFQLFSKDVPERHSRIDALIHVYQQKISYLERFQAGCDIWKERK